MLLHPIQAQQHCSILLTSVNNVGSKTLFSPVEQRARRFLPCSVHYMTLRTTSCNVHYSGSILYDNERETWSKSTVSTVCLVEPLSVC